MAKKIHWSVLGGKRGKLFDKIISFREEAEGRKKSSVPFFSWYQDFEQTRTSISEKNRMKKMILEWRLGTARYFYLATLQNLFSHFHCHRYESKCIYHNSLIREWHFHKRTSQWSKYCLSPVHLFLPQTSAWPCPQGWKWYSGRWSWEDDHFAFNSVEQC